MKLLNFIKDLKVWQIGLGLICLAFVIRFPFFFIDFIDRDESTFIIMGNSWANGHLPFTEVWDLKSPLTFGYFAILIAAFGKNLLLIRLGGSIIVGLVGLFTYLIGSKILNKTCALLSAILSIYLLSLFDALQGVMSEHIAVLPLLIGFYYLIKKQSKTNLFIAGLFFGIVLMTRINLGIPILILLIFEFIRWIVYSKKWIINTLFISIGIAIPFISLVLLYYFNNELDIFFNSVFIAPLNYSKTTLANVLHILPTIFILLIVSVFAFTRLRSKKKNTTLNLLLVFVLGELIMFLKGGKINGHYLIQIYPFVAILFIGFLSTLINNNNKAHKWTYRISLALILLLPIQSYIQAGNLIHHWVETKRLYKGNTFLVTDYIGNEKNVFFLNNHLGYWLLNTLPPTPVATHPSNIFRGFNYKYIQNTQESPAKELAYILDYKKPKYIIYNEHKLPIPSNQTYYNYFFEYLDAHYFLSKTIDDVRIYKRVN